MSAHRVCGVAAALLMLVGASAPASKDAAPSSAGQPVMLAVVNATYQDFLDDLVAASYRSRPKLEFMFEPPYQPPAVLVQYMSPDGQLRVVGLEHDALGSYLREWLKSKASVDYTEEANLTSANKSLATLGLPLIYPTLVFFELDEHTSAVLYVTSPYHTPENDYWYTDEKFFSAELTTKSIPDRLPHWERIQEVVASHMGQVLLDTTPMLMRGRRAVGKGAIWVVVSTPSQREQLASFLSAIPPAESERWVSWQEQWGYAALEFYLYPPLAQTRALEFAYNPILHRGSGEPWAGPVLAHVVEPSYLIDQVSKWDTILAGFFELRNGSIEVLLFRGYKERPG